MTNEGLRAPSGPYAIEVTARDSDDRAVNVSQNSTGLVQGVSFEQGFPLLHLDSGLAVPIADLLKVSPPPNTTE
jgi:flagellar hook assembly protein FlgD